MKISKQPVFVFNPKDAERINYYVNDPDWIKKLLGFQAELDLEVYDYNARTIESEKQIKLIFEDATPLDNEFYLIIREHHLERNTYNSQILYDYLNDNFEYLSQENFGRFLIFTYKVNITD